MAHTRKAIGQESGLHHEVQWVNWRRANATDDVGQQCLGDLGNGLAEGGSQHECIGSEEASCTARRSQSNRAQQT